MKQMTLTNATNEEYRSHCNREIWPSHSIILIILCLMITLGLSHVGKVEGKMLQEKGTVYVFALQQGGSAASDSSYQPAQRSPDLCLLPQNNY